MKILGIVLLYNPDEKQMISNIDKYADSLIRLIVWNNTEQSNDYYKTLLKETQYFNKLLFFGGNGNEGLSKPINLAMHMALDEKYDCLLTMDQDSIWKNFNQYIYTIEKDIQYRNKIFVPSINDETEYDCEYVQYKNFIINSGTMYGCNAIAEVGYMNSLFFVEGIDTDYSIRAQIKEVPIIKINNGKMLQNIKQGEMKYRQLLFFHLLECKYNANRLYGISYSEIIMFRKFPEPYKSLIRTQFRSLFGWRMLLSIIIYGNNKTKRLFYYFKGIIDGYRFNIHESI